VHLENQNKNKSHGQDRTNSIKEKSDILSSVYTYKENGYMQGTRWVKYSL